MNSIATEVQRITNTTSNLTTAQIQTGLESVVLQEKTVIPATETQTVTPDNNYYGLSKVTVNPALLQEKTITPTTEQQTIMPDEGYYGISRITVEAVEDSGDGSTAPMFASLSSGILPTVYKGTASSKFILDFESSAIGALSE